MIHAYSGSQFRRGARTLVAYRPVVSIMGRLANMPPRVAFVRGTGTLARPGSDKSVQPTEVKPSAAG